MNVDLPRLQCVPDLFDTRRDAPLHPPDVAKLDGATHYDTAVAYEALELPEDAIYEFEMAADDPAWSFPSWRSVGRLHHARSRWEQATQAYERALAVAGDDPSSGSVVQALDLAREHTPLPGTVAVAAPVEPDGLLSEQDLDQAFDDLFV